MVDFQVFLLDTNLDENNDGLENLFAPLKAIINNITLFDDVDQCVGFLTDIEKRNVFLIVSNTLAESIIPVIHDIPQLWIILIFSEQNYDCEEYIQQLPKVKGVFTEIYSVCNILEQIIKQHEENMIPYSLITTDDADSFINGIHFTFMDQSFMYANLFKGVFSETNDYNDVKYIKALANYTRRVFKNSAVYMEKIKNFECDFWKHKIIWWYTYDYFLFAMLNHAIRTLDIELIFRMGFIVDQLSYQIKKLRQQQSVRFQTPFTVYRRQTMPEEDFLKLQQAKGGLLIFNSFLLTNIDQSTATMFNHSNLKLVNILFIMHINPDLSTTPFAALNQDVECFGDHEKEILFCTQTIFRITEIKQMVKDNYQVWHIYLILVADDDPKLVAMNNRVREETSHTSGLGEMHTSEGWEQLGFLLLATNESNKAAELCQLLYTEASDDVERVKYSSMLAQVYNTMKNYPQALSYFENTLAIVEKIQPWNHSALADLYSSMGLVHSRAGEYSQALSFQEFALNIRENTLHPNDPKFSQSYINLGWLYLEMRNWSLAISYLEKGIEILEKSLPPSHPTVKNSIVAIKRAKKGMFDEEKERMKQNEGKTTSGITNINHEKPTSRTEKCTIYGRNHTSVYLNESHQRVHYKLYWLNMNNFYQADLEADLEAELRHTIPLMEMFDSTKDCEEAIQDVVNCTIVLIIAGLMAHEAIPRIHNLANVTKIFIYSADHNDTEFEALIKTYNKIVAVVLTPHDLVEKIVEDWEEKETRSLLSFGIVSRWDVSLEANEPNMLWFKLLISCLVSFDNKDNTAKKDLLEFMRKSYRGNTKQLQDIDIFEQTYLAIDAIHWYTRDFCLYRLVNKAFRQGNINSLFSLRLFIKDLYTQLNSLHAQQHQIRQKNKQLLVRSYRGQPMLRSGLMNLSSNKYVITSSFFSTSMDREQAFGFLAGGVANDDQILVFFVIDGNISLKSAPFADITSVSSKYDENEVLYAPGTLFRLRSQQTDPFNDVYIIELELCNDVDLPSKTIYDTFAVENGRDIDLLSFSLFLHDMGEYRKAKKFLLRFLSDLKKENMDPAMCYHSLGRVAMGVDDYSVAVIYQEIALDIRIQVTPTDFNDLAQICNHLAEGYCYQNRSYLANEYNDFAIECSLQIEDIHRRNILLSNCYHTDGRIKLLEQQFCRALRSFNVSLDYRRRVYPPDHPFIAKIYMTIGKTYSLMEQYHAALKMYKMAKDIFLKCLPITHPHIGEVLYSLGTIAIQMGIQGQTDPDLGDIHTNFSEAYDIFHHSLPARSERFLIAKKTLENVARAQIDKSNTQLEPSLMIATPASMLF